MSFEKLVVGDEYDRKFLAKTWGYGGYQAISKGVVTPAGTKLIVLFVTKEKQSGLTQYSDYIDGNRLHWEGEEKHRSDRRIVSANDSGDQIHLFYRDIHHTPFRYLGPVHLVEHTLRSEKPSEFVFSLTERDSADALDDIASHARELAELTETEQTAIQKSRIGQGLFRSGVIELWGCCAVTGLSNTALLRASHIKPWRDSNNAERLDPANGLLLQPTLDLLFDSGLISFEAAGRIRVSPALSVEDQTVLGVVPEMTLSRMPEGVDKYLSYHRDCIFQSAK